MKIKLNNLSLITLLEIKFLIFISVDNKKKIKNSKVLDFYLYEKLKQTKSKQRIVYLS